MQRSNSNSMKQPQYLQHTDPTRYSSTHSTSSAFSASANPNEDWTKISDLAERRRIQNRIAQRNYRKKLKRRLEDLERKAASTSASPEPSHAELAMPSVQKEGVSGPNSTNVMSRVSRASSTTSQDQQLSPELFALEDPFANITMQDPQYQYLSLPFPYSNGTSTSDYFNQDFSFCGSQPVPQIYAEPHFQADFAHSLPPTLPAMNQLDALKNDPYAIDDDFLNPFGISYATLVGMEVPPQQMQPGFVSRSPSSSGSWSSTDSRENSPPYFAQPMTPLSRSTSPNVQLFDHSWQ